MSHEIPNASDFINKLLQISYYYKLDNDIVRSNAYDNAANNLRSYEFDNIDNLYLLSNVKGVGKSIRQDLKEYYETGKILRLIDLEHKFSDRKQLLDLFMGIYGVGPVIANEFIDQGYTNLNELSNNKNLLYPQLLGIKWYLHLQFNIPQVEMDYIASKIHHLFKQSNILKYDFVGSYRRKELFSSDIDILINSDDDNITIDYIINILKKKNLIMGDLYKSEYKYLGIIQFYGFNAHRIDIFLAKPSYYYFSLLSFTGSKKFNILMRRQAHTLGYSLTEYGIKKYLGSYLPPLYSEEQIFNFLKVKYIPPEGRTNNLVSLEFI